MTTLKPPLRLKTFKRFGESAAPDIRPVQRPVFMTKTKLKANSREMASDGNDGNDFDWKQPEDSATNILEPLEQEVENLENNTVNDVEADKNERLARLPISRVRHIMKLDPDVNIASQEAVFLISKATELFIESLAREACSFTVQSKKKTIQRRDIDASIMAVDALSFLDGALD